MRRLAMVAVIGLAAVALARGHRRHDRQQAIADVVAGITDGASQALLEPVKTDAAPRFVVELDPGHGGSNTGAAGVLEGVYEKRLTLAVARLVAAKLAKAPGVVVLMTRSDDRYVTLRERVRQANRDAADVFVSIHLNASPTKAQHGFETWVLGPEALDVDARAIRVGDGPGRDGVPAVTAELLDDVERGAVIPGAIRLGKLVQQHLAAVRGAGGDRGVRQGNQDVLIGPVMPAVLVEIGFIDHPEEGRELLQPTTLEPIADAIADAIVDYEKSR